MEHHLNVFNQCFAVAEEIIKYPYRPIYLRLSWQIETQVFSSNVLSGFEAGGPNTPSNIDPWSIIGAESSLVVSTDRSSCFERNKIAVRMDVLCDSSGANICPPEGVGIYNPGFWGMVRSCHYVFAIYGFMIFSVFILLFIFLWNFAKVCIIFFCLLIHFLLFTDFDLYLFNLWFPEYWRRKDVQSCSLCPIIRSNQRLCSINRIKRVAETGGWEHCVSTNGTCNFCKLIFCFNFYRQSLCKNDLI